MSWNNDLDGKITKAYDSDYEAGGHDDPDSYDDYGEVNNPFSPIWDGSTAHNDALGEDYSFPDSNDISQD